MARYRYAGQNPQEDGAGGIVRPGDVREFDAEPAWGPWDAVDGGAVSPSEPPATQAPAAAAPSPAPASPAAPASPPADTGSTGKGI